MSTGGAMSETAKHTPGDWPITYAVIASEDGDPDNDSIVASAPIARTMGETTANAHLIRVAPKLLEALKKIAAEDANDGKDICSSMYSMIVRMHNIATDAIAKAEPTP